MPNPGRHLRTLTVTVALIVISAVFPLIWTTSERPLIKGPNDIEVQQLTASQANAWLDQNPAVRMRQEARLMRLRDQGFLPAEPLVFTGRPYGAGRSIGDSMFSASADYFDADAGYVILTPLNDGNPNTEEWDVYAVRDVEGITVWGTQQMDVWNPDSPWTFGEGMDDGRQVAQPGAIENLCGLLSTDVSAVYNCNGDWHDAGEILANSFAGALLAVGGASVPCFGFTLGWGVCVSGSFAGTFVGGLMYNTYNWSASCPITEGSIEQIRGVDTNASVGSEDTLMPNRRSSHGLAEQPYPRAGDASAESGAAR